MKKIAFALCLLASASYGDVLPYSPSWPSGNNSGTITTGGTFQALATQNSNRKSVEFQNICNVSGNCAATTDNCYLFWPSSASETKATSLQVPPGAYYLRSTGVLPSDPIDVTCDGTSDKYWSETQ